ncbi:sulfurtransferase TusA family protein [Lentisphaera marina]|uniref:sulfurtransferase TusA family protein n=1 Tax=Lentisphaera marina TaxID=1111041 RepID=UPI0023666E70|nr:sulfurtransferase TusA family protein [Lentisphaera marina]MDD7984129.1 sulfurtransferase TusA family protein [Lentisphaera marina]
MSRVLEFELSDEVQEELVEFKGKKENYESGEMSMDAWQKRRLWQGIYGQRQPEVQMIRVKVPYGITNSKQVRQLAAMAEKHSNNVLHITTRSAIQMHYVPFANTPEFIKDLTEVGLTSREGCGNTIRNVTADPFASTGAGQLFDVVPVAKRVVEHSLRNPYAQNFPRKFKMTFSGNEAEDNGHSFMHDVGFIASKIEDGSYKFNVYAGGGLGGRPIGADLVDEDLPVEDALICATAFMRIFNEHGNRENRNKARMKFIKHEWGLDKFIEAYKAEFNRIKESEYGQSLVLSFEEGELALPQDSADVSKVNAFVDDAEWVKNCVRPQNVEDLYTIQVRVDLGDFTSDQARTLSDIADKFGSGEIRTLPSQNIVLTDVKLENVAGIYAELKAAGYANSQFHHITNVVACPGRSTCNLSVTSSKGLAEALNESFKDEADIAEVGDKVRINISGCHNGCGRHSVASIGFNGSSRVLGDKAVPCAMMQIGGGVGFGRREMARRVGRVAAKKAPEAVRAVIDHYKSQNSALSLEDWLVEVDVKELKPIIKPFDAVEAYDENPDVYADYQQAEGEEYSPAVGAGECAGGVLNLVGESLDDAHNYITMARKVFDQEFFADVIFNSQEAMRHAFDAALMQAGEKVSDYKEAFDKYVEFFTSNTVTPDPKAILREDTPAEVTFAFAAEYLQAAELFVNDFVAVYNKDKDACAPFLNTEEEKDGRPFLDLRGIECPMNYVKAKLVLNGLEDGKELAMIIDTGDSFRQVPSSLKKDGHTVVELDPINDNQNYSLIVLKNGEANK